MGRETMGLVTSQSEEVGRRGGGVGRSAGERQTRYLGSKWTGVSFRPRAVTGSKEQVPQAVRLRPAWGQSMGSGCQRSGLWAGGRGVGRWGVVLLLLHFSYWLKNVTSTTFLHKMGLRSGILARVLPPVLL